MPSSKSSFDSDFPESLEEFGLSKYEARAYLTMIGKGSLAVSEIAYYANLPRTKVYQTVKKLEKKRLAVVSRQKPLICSAIPPEEAFSELIDLHERRAKNMKKIIDRLQKLNDAGQKPKGSEERRYFILDPNSALEKIGSLIAHSRSSVVATMDAWGLRLAIQCKPSLVRALTNGSRIRVILGSQCLGSEGLFSLPEGVELRLAGREINLSNLLIVDSTHIVSIDSSSGKSALFISADSFGALQARNIEREWEKSSELKRIEGMEPAVVTKAVELAGIVDNGLAAKMLEYAVSESRLEMPAALIDVIDEKYGFRLGDMSSSEVMHIIDSALRINCLGGLRHDRANNVVSLLSKLDGKQVLPWALVLASYFKRAGNEPKIMQQSSKGTQLVQLRLTKPVVP